MFFQRGFRGTRSQTLRSNPFNQKMRSMQVTRYARSNPFFNDDMKQAFGRANQAVNVLEQKHKTFNTGAKETFVDSQLQHRVVGRDAMIQARESERKNEDNPLLRSVETLPHQFTRREINTVINNVAAMEEEKPTIQYRKTLPLNEPKFRELKGNTEVKKSKAHKCKEFVATPRKSDDLDQKIPAGQGLKRSRPEAIHLTAPVINESQKDDIQPSKLKAIMTKAKVSTIIKSKRRKYN